MTKCQMNESPVISLMVSVNSIVIAAVATVAIAEANPQSAVPWQCYASCGKALTQHNKCKSKGGQYHDCVCAENSMFRAFLEPCLNCGDLIWAKYGNALAKPMKECGISR